MSKKSIVIVIVLIIVFAVILNIIINHSNLPQLMEKSNKKSIEYDNCKGGTYDLDCIANRANTIDQDRKNCVKVLAEPTSYYPETVQKCKDL